MECRFHCGLYILAYIMVKGTNGCLKVKQQEHSSILIPYSLDIFIQEAIKGKVFGFVMFLISAIVWSDHSINHFLKVETTKI